MVYPIRALTESHPKTARRVAEGTGPAPVVLANLKRAHGGDYQGPPPSASADNGPRTQAAGSSGDAFLSRHRPHPRIDPDGHGIEDRVEVHPPLPRRLLGSGDCLLNVALLLLEQERLNLPGLGLAGDGTGQLVEPLVELLHLGHGLLVGRGLDRHELSVAVGG